MDRLRVDTGVPGWSQRAAAALPRGDRVRTVAVEGRSGAGKSTVAEHLRRAWAARGEAVHVLTMEDLYTGWEGMAEGSEILRARVLGPLARGRAPVWRRWDWEHGGRERTPTQLPAQVLRGGVLLVEGTGSGAAPARSLVDLLVWVHAPEAVRARRLDQRADAQVYAPHRRSWADQEERFMRRHRPDAHARVWVDNTPT